MSYLSGAHVTHVSYILILFSLSFLLYLFVNILLHIYAVHTWPDDESNGQRALAAATSTRKSPHSRNVSFADPPYPHYLSSPTSHRRTDSLPITPFLDHEPQGLALNSSTNSNSNIPHQQQKQKNPAPRLPRKHTPTDSQQVRDAEEFELEGLISDLDEDADETRTLDIEKQGGKTEQSV